MAAHFFLVAEAMFDLSGTLLCRKWSEFLKDLAPSIECMSNTGIPGKNSRAPVPGSKLFSAFQATGASEREGARQFTELGALLMHAQHSQTSAFGTCDVMVSSQTLRTTARPAATEEVLYKLSSGYNKRLWPVLHVDEPSENLVMPSDAADHASRKYLVGCLQKASSAINSGDGASLLPGKAGVCVVIQLHRLCILSTGPCDVTVMMQSAAADHQLYMPIYYETSPARRKLMVSFALNKNLVCICNQVSQTHL